MAYNLLPNMASVVLLSIYAILILCELLYCRITRQALCQSYWKIGLEAVLVVLMVLLGVSGVNNCYAPLYSGLNRFWAIKTAPSYHQADFESSVAIGFNVPSSNLFGIPLQKGSF